ncbi:MAG: hypothetical protein ACLQGP_35620 [Isosphaeraceae bacterium]
MFRKIGNPWMLAAVCLVGAVIAPVLVGFAPLDGDPELMYQPIKSELGRSLAEGRLPFWSDRFGLGVPLVAESHMAAFYPPNWLFYRLWAFETAYGLTMWVHWIALAAATFAYARSLGIGAAGAAMAAMGFALCGFQAVHAAHEPFYHLMPYLPLCLILADRFAATGRPAWLAALAMAWGVQILLGHFQIQMWTGGLVLLVGAWRALGSPEGRVPRGPGHPRPAPWRILGLMVGLAWGLAIAFVQLRLTWELKQVTGFERPPKFLSNFLFPLPHWAQFALPEVFMGRPQGVGQEEYWSRLKTTAGEACAYVGVVPLILAFVGWFAGPRDRRLAPWKLVGLLSLVLATMPGWWPEAYDVLLDLPGLGTFRAPARYTLLTSLVVVLLAGRGFDRSIAPRRFWGGLALAVVFGASAWAWSIYWAQRPDFRAGQDAGTIASRFAGAGLAWGLGLLAVVGWRLGRLGAWAPIAVTVLELGALLFVGPARWSWRAGLPESSPVLRRLAELPDVGLVGGRLYNLPVDAGLTVAYPNLGITPPPPNYLIESATRPPGETSHINHQWQNRFGVTHGIWGAGDPVEGTEVLAVIPDPALDRVIESVPHLRVRGPWKLVKTRGPFPAARVASRIMKAETWGELYTTLSDAEFKDDAWVLAEDEAPALPGPAARSSRVLGWDGRTASVEHDGSCVLILRRTYYPGWTYRIDGGPERPVFKVDGGLHGIPLVGAGTSRVELRYRPTGLDRAATVSLSALAAALLVAAVGWWSAARSDRG